MPQLICRDESHEGWRFVCVAFALPAMVLPLLRLVLNPHTPLGDAILEIGAGLASLGSGPGGLYALKWEWNYPITADWGYLWFMAVSAGLEWTAIWWIGEHLRIRGKLVRWWLLAGVMILFLVCLWFHLITIVIRHT